MNQVNNYQNLTFEIWKRILNNLPYFYKTKGTVRSLKSLIAAYGIPPSILQVKEYYNLNSVDYINNNDSYKLEFFNTYLPFYGNQGIYVKWSPSIKYNRHPRSIQIRFKTFANSYTKNNEIVILNFGSITELSVILVPVGDENSKKGRIKVTAHGSTLFESGVFDLYDGNYIFLTIQHEEHGPNDSDNYLKLYIKRYINGKIESYIADLLDNLYLYSGYSTRNEAISKLLIYNDADSLLCIGGVENGFKFFGGVDEFRLWNTHLNNNILDIHAKFPESCVGNNIESIYNDLLLRISFSDPFNLGDENHVNKFIESIISNSVNYYTEYDILSILGWDNEPNFPYSYRIDSYEAEIYYNLGLNIYSSNRIKIEKSQLEGPLSPYHSREKLRNNKGYYSNKVGIFFSPVELINEKIIKTLSISNIADLIGDPEYYYKNCYENLRILNDFYWKFENNNKIYLSDYFNYIKHYDTSLFDHIKEFIPARCKSILGVLYEPTILERPKVEYKEPHISTDNNFECSVSASYGNIYSDTCDTFTNIKIINNNIFNNIFELSNYNISNSLYLGNLFSGINGTFSYNIEPMVDFDSDLIIYMSGSDAELKLSSVQIYDFNSGYNYRHYINHQCFQTWEKRLKYFGCIQTEKTTIDKIFPVEVWETNPNKLIALDDGISDLQVI